MDHVLDMHRVRVEGDVLYVHLDGDLGKEHMGWFLGLVESVIAQHGRYGTVVDTRKLGRFSSEARGLVSNFQAVASCYGNAVFGESFATRVVVTMALRTMEIIGRQTVTLEFCKDEIEARAWLKRRSEAGAAT